MSHPAATPHSFLCNYSIFLDNAQGVDILPQFDAITFESLSGAVLKASLGGLC